MRSTEERVMAVKLQAKKIENQKQMTRGRILYISAAVACLMFIVGLSFLIPETIGSMPEGEYKNFATTASMFEGSIFLGYILIGFLAFALGVSVTILAYRINLKNQLEQGKKETKGGKND